MPYATNPIDGFHIYYETEGDGPPLMLHSGLTGGILSWRHYGYVEALKDSYQVILIDPRGHGRSAKPHDPHNYALNTLSADVIAILDDLSVERTHYLGYSLGAFVGYVAAHSAPDRFLSLITGGGPIHLPGEFVETLIPVLEQGPEALLAAFDQPPGTLSESRRAQLLESDTQAFIALIKSQRQKRSLEPLLPEISIPALVYVGEDDFLYQAARKASELLPNATFVSLPGLDHLQVTAHSDMVLPHVADFLNGIPANSHDA